jgi:hypothetical protein
MSEGRGCGGTGRFLHGIKEGGPWERLRVRNDTGSEPKARDAHRDASNTVTRVEP